MQMLMISIKEVTTEAMEIMKTVWFFFFPEILRKFGQIKSLLSNQNWIDLIKIKRLSVRGTQFYEYHLELRNWLAVVDQGSLLVLQMKASRIC